MVAFHETSGRFVFRRVASRKPLTAKVLQTTVFHHTCIGGTLDVFAARVSQRNAALPARLSPGIAVVSAATIAEPAPRSLWPGFVHGERASA
jgi:hypothetical protein